MLGLQSALKTDLEGFGLISGSCGFSVRTEQLCTCSGVLSLIISGLRSTSEFVKFRFDESSSNLKYLIRVRLDVILKLLYGPEY